MEGNQAAIIPTQIGRVAILQRRHELRPSLMSGLSLFGHPDDFVSLPRRRIVVVYRKRGSSCLGSSGGPSPLFLPIAHPRGMMSRVVASIFKGVLLLPAMVDPVGCM